MTLIQLNIFSLVLGIELAVINCQMCTDPRRFGDVIQNGKERRGSGAEFKTIENVGLVQCWKICIQYSLCTSINFINSKCTLLTGNNLAVVSKAGSITSEKKDWAIERIAGNCYNHKCPSNAACIETSKGFSCEVIGCVDPPADYATYKVFGHYTVWAENDSVAIPCDNLNGCTKLFRCQQDGLWANATYIKEGQFPSCLNESKWTKWFDRDGPSYTGDHETIQAIQQTYPGQLCNNPSSIDFRLKSSNYQFGNDVLILSPSIGLICINNYQFERKCKDYKVRFCC